MGVGIGLGVEDRAVNFDHLTQVQQQRIPCHHIDYQNNRDKIRKHLEIDVSMYEKLGRENCWPHATV